MKVSINIVNTPGYGYELKSNKVLLSQLIKLAEMGVIINILVNGYTKEAYDFLADNYPKFKLLECKKRQRLGSARQILYDYCVEEGIDYYMPFDEDDDFDKYYEKKFKEIISFLRNNHEVQLLYPKIGEIYEGNKISNCYPDWVTEENLRMGLKTSLIQGTEYLVNSCFISINDFPDLKWTDTNLCEDMNLHLEFFKKGVSLIYYPEILVNYHAERSQMSTQKKDPNYDDRVILQNLTPLKVSGFVKELDAQKPRFEHDSFNKLWKTLQYTALE